MTTLILGLTVAGVSISLAAALVARMRRKALERIIRTWEEGDE